MHHQLGRSAEDDMNKMSVIGHFFQKINSQKKSSPKQAVQNKSGGARRFKMCKLVKNINIMKSENESVNESENENESESENE